jgi:hypothetical protein
MTDPITSDNFQLSRPTTSRLVSADDGTPLSVLSCSDPKIIEFIAATTAPNTQRAYESDLRHFVLWGGHLPATSEQVARYLADHASILSMATLARRLAGIRDAHVKRGFPDPTKSALVRLTLVKWLLDVAFGRSQDEGKETARKIHRLGTIKRLIDEDDD